MRTSGAVLLAILVVLAGCETEEGIPDNAEMLVDEDQKRYLTPPCFDGAADRGDIEYIATFEEVPRRTTWAEVEQSDFRADAACRDLDGFSGARTSLLRLLSDQIGLTSRVSRWQPDGAWNW